MDVVRKGLIAAVAVLMATSANGRQTGWKAPAMTPIEVGAVVDGSLDPADQDGASDLWRDWYVLSAEAGETLTITIEGGGAAPRLWLYEARGDAEPVRRATTMALREKRAFSHLVRKTGPYFLTVGSNTPGGVYRVRTSSNKRLGPVATASAEPLAETSSRTVASGGLRKADPVGAAIANHPSPSVTPGPFEKPEAWGLFADIARRGALVSSRSGSSWATVSYTDGKIAVGIIYKLGSKDGRLYSRMPCCYDTWRGEVVDGGSVVWEPLHGFHDRGRIARDDLIGDIRRYRKITLADNSVFVEVPLRIQPASQFLPAEHLPAARDAIDALEATFEADIARTERAGDIEDAADDARWARQRVMRERNERTSALLNGLGSALNAAQQTAAQSEARSARALQDTIAEQSRRRQQSPTASAPSSSPARSGQTPPLPSSTAKFPANETSGTPAHRPTVASANAGAGRQCVATAEKYLTYGIPWETRDVAQKSLMDHPKAAQFTDVTCKQNGSLWTCTANIPTGRTIERCGPSSASRQ